VVIIVEGLRVIEVVVVCVVARVWRGCARRLTFRVDVDFFDVSNSSFAQLTLGLLVVIDRRLVTTGSGATPLTAPATAPK
jgi:hypothetical protein